LLTEVHNVALVVEVPPGGVTVHPARLHSAILPCLGLV
jgi:hypothetical protein